MEMILIGLLFLLLFVLAIVIIAIPIWYAVWTLVLVQAAKLAWNAAQVVVIPAAIWVGQAVSPIAGEASKLAFKFSSEVIISVLQTILSLLSESVRQRVAQILFNALNKLIFVPIFLISLASFVLISANDDIPEELKWLLRVVAVCSLLVLLIKVYDIANNREISALLKRVAERPSEINVIGSKNVAVIGHIGSGSNPSINQTQTVSEDMNTHNTTIRAESIGSANTGSGSVTSDQIIGTQNNHNSQEKRDLAEAAAEIQRLLKMLEENNPDATEAQQVDFVSAAVTPTFKQRAVHALQSGGKAALEQLLDNPYVNVAVATIEGWKESS